MCGLGFRPSNRALNGSWTDVIYLSRMITFEIVHSLLVNWISDSNYLVRADPLEMCGYHPCKVAKCVTEPTAMCVSNSKCKPIFFNRDGKIINSCKGKEYRFTEIRKASHLCLDKKERLNQTATAIATTRASKKTYASFTRINFRLLTDIFKVSVRPIGFFIVLESA